MKKKIDVLKLVVEALCLAALFQAFVFGQVPVLTGANQGFYTPTCDRPQINGNTTYTGSIGYCHVFYLPFTRTVTQGRFATASGKSGTVDDEGIYDLNGNLLINLGGISTSPGGTNLGGPIVQGSVTLQGGNMYWACSTNSDTTSTVNRSAIVVNVGLDAVSNLGTTTAGSIITPGTGLLPSTMGTITPATGIAWAVAWWY